MICEGTISHWLAKVTLRTCSDECKLIYRKFEKLKIRIINERFHLQFNLACINNYIYIYVELNESIRVRRKSVSNSCHSKIAYKSDITQPNQT